MNGKQHKNVSAQCPPPSRSAVSTLYTVARIDDLATMENHMPTIVKKKA